MVVDVLINTRFLLLGNDINSSLGFPEIILSKDEHFRKEVFYDTLGVEELGTYVALSPLQKYAYGYTANDLTYITSDSSREKKMVDLAAHSLTMQSFLNTYLFLLWFEKDNSISADYAYVRTKPILFPSVNTIVQNDINMYTCTCGQVETEFSEMELTYVYNLGKRINAICPKNKNTIHEQAPTQEDISDPTKMFVHSEVEYQDYGRLERAILFLSKARMESHILPKISAYCSVLECLFSTEQTDITYKISQRVALYVGNDYDERLYLKKLIGTAYNIRSRYIHGNKISVDDLKEKGNFRKDKLLKTSTEIDNVLRIVLTKIITEDHEVFNDDNKLSAFFDTLIFS